MAPMYRVKSAPYLGEDEDRVEYTSEVALLLGKPEITKEENTAWNGLGKLRSASSNARAWAVWAFQRYLVIYVVLVLSIISCIGILMSNSYHTKFYMSSKKAITMDHIFNSTFAIRSRTLRWVPEAGDGVYADAVDGNIVLVNLNLNTTKTLLERGTVYDVEGRTILWDDWKLSPDMKYILLKTDSRKQWRYSTFGNYYIHSFGDNSTRPLVPPTSPSQIAYATWSPTGESVAYVFRNDLYVMPDPSGDTQPLRVTSDGSVTVFNGVPDWVYEEEVFESDHALWWSPDSKKIAFLRWDETLVNTYMFPVYNPTGDRGDATAYLPYTNFVSIKYPKPGFANPIVSAHMFALSTYDPIFPETFPPAYELKWEGSITPDDRVIQELVWVSNSSLLMKEVNRSADEGSVVLFELGSGGALSSGKAVRTLGKDGEHPDGGYIDFQQRIVPLLHVAGYPSGAYVDIVPSPEGYNHLALFASADAKRPHWLTGGKWEVDGTALAVDSVKGLVYFVAAAPTDLERNLFTAPLPPTSRLTSNSAPSTHLPPSPTMLSGDATMPAYYSAAFSPQAAYYSLRYEGPDVPWQELRKTGDTRYRLVLEDNAELNLTSAEYAMPVIKHGTVEVDEYVLNVKELRPPNMDDSGRTKYPILFNLYNGPGFQLVDYRFRRDWHHYLVTTLGYVVVLVDGRGTGFKGREFRNWVRGKCGYWESHDHVEAARQWITRPYIDQKRVGVWGKSYGGFVTTKIMERGAGVHTLGMAVAPVTDWRMYDSVATERFMMTLQRNPEGYLNSSVRDVKPFGKVDYLLAHGTGDDNVHFAHSAHLLDEFTANSVRGFAFRMFIDSDHRLVTRNAERELHEWMSAFLVEKWGRAT